MLVKVIEAIFVMWIVATLFWGFKGPAK